VNPVLPEAVAEFAATADRAVAAAGGADLARAAELDPETRAGKLRRLLAGVGLAELDPTADDESAAAAAELCRIAGRWALPYPVAAVLAGGEQPLAVVGEGDLRVNHADLYPVWRLARIDGSATLATPTGEPLGSRLGPFVGAMEAGGLAEASPVEVALTLTFSAWRVLGAAERAVELAVEHVRDRQQFGQSLSRFQAVQFQIADAAVAVDGLRELCRWTLWRVLSVESSRAVDPLALRLHALDAGRQVLRTCQQLFGASGLCDEYDVSLLVRHTQPELRLPWGSELTASLLFAAVRADGFESLFPQGRPA
jgi:hypothetical protein